MTFSPLTPPPALGATRAPVSFCSSTRGRRNRKRSAYLSFAAEYAEDLGWTPGMAVLVEVGDGRNAGQIRITPDPLAAFVVAAARKPSTNKVARTLKILLGPWEGFADVPLTACTHKATRRGDSPAILQIDLPLNAIDAPDSTEARPAATKAPPPAQAPGEIQPASAGPALNSGVADIHDGPEDGPRPVPDARLAT